MVDGGEVHWWVVGKISNFIHSSHSIVADVANRFVPAKIAKFALCEGN